MMPQGRWVVTRSELVAAWLLTYALHSTLLLALAWALTQRLVRAPTLRDLIWKTALLGGLASATVQTLAGIEPLAGSVAIAATADEWTAASRNDGQTVGRSDGQFPADIQPASPSDRPTVSSTVGPAAQPIRRIVVPSLRPSAWLLLVWGVVGGLLAVQFLFR